MPNKKSPEYIGRVLFLHGFTQSSSVFYAKTSALRKKLKSLKYQSVYLNAPFNLTPSQLPSSDALSKFNSVAAEPDEDTNYRAWWFKDAEGKVKLDDAISTIRQYIDNGTILPGSPEDEKIKADHLAELGSHDSGTSGNTSASDSPDAASSESSASAKASGSLNSPPIVGIIGFSQGACLGGALVEKFEATFGVPLKFAILYSGFKLDTKLMPEYSSFYTNDDGESTKTRLLHVIGELDTIVGDDRAYTLYDISKKNSHVLKHPGGHFVPNSKLMVNQVTNWIQSLDMEEKKPQDTDKGIEWELDQLTAAVDKLGK
ncbi:hypothetical protein JCM33374_g1818 [Metschnikowia sp. JCM 33374]|nr:hypothetical protein JCM33374_g1818 [Metschnikowia sp. JCM 33374]